MLEEAKELLAKRDADYPANLLAAKEKLDGVDGGEAKTVLSEIYFWLGEYSGDDKEKDTYFKAGVDVGKEAVKASPNSAAAHLWFAANMGAHGVVRGIMSSLFYVKDIEKSGKKALDIEEGYFFGAPARLLGRFYHQAPGFPIGPGDNKKALKLLEKAVQLGPQFFMNHVYLADVLISRYKKADAKKLLQQVVDSDGGDLPNYHKAVVVPEAEKLLKKV